jgi:hypoxanthine phosphoribosyltransferase
VTVTRVLIDGPEIAVRVAELARDIQRDAGVAPLHLVAILKGSFVFLADLMRSFEAPVTCDFLAISMDPISPRRVKSA